MEGTRGNLGGVETWAMEVGQGFGVWGFCRCVAGLFPFHHDAGSALLGGGLDAFVTCFLSGLFLTAEADPMGLLGFTRT